MPLSQSQFLLIICNELNKLYRSFDWVKNEEENKYKIKSELSEYMEIVVPELLKEKYQLSNFPFKLKYF
jgi:hypothetical protein